MSQSLLALLKAARLPKRGYFASYLTNSVETSSEIKSCALVNLTDIQLPIETN